MTDKPTCSNCRFRGWTGTQFYDCRRHAPVAIPEPQRRGGVTEPHWPMVEAHHWCGDHDPAAVAPSQAPGLPPTLAELRHLIADDAHAMTFQTFGQYRTALLKAADKIAAGGRGPNAA